MADHVHKFTHWPFEDAANTAVFLCDHVDSGASAILWVCHDHDGDWQFLCMGDHSDSKPLLVCLGCTTDDDPSLFELADMPMGWSAERDGQGAPWHREPLPLESNSRVDA